MSVEAEIHAAALYAAELDEALKSAEKAAKPDKDTLKALKRMDEARLPKVG